MKSGLAGKFVQRMWAGNADRITSPSPSRLSTRAADPSENHASGEALPFLSGNVTLNRL